MPQLWQHGVLQLSGPSQGSSLCSGSADMLPNPIGPQQELHEVDFYFLFIYFLGLPVQHMETSRLRIELELQLLAYITATLRPELNCVCDLHYS